MSQSNPFVRKAAKLSKAAFEWSPSLKTNSFDAVSAMMPVSRNPCRGIFSRVFTLTFERALLNMHIMLGHSLSFCGRRNQICFYFKSVKTVKIMVIPFCLPCQHTILKTADWLVDSKVTLLRSCHVYKRLPVKSSRVNNITFIDVPTNYTVNGILFSY